jgi:hypothetical protein
MDELIKFIKINAPQYAQESDELIASIILSHVRTNTFDALRVNGEIKACVRYAILNDGRVGDCLDLIIKPGENGKKIIKYFVAKAWVKFPSMKFVRFERQYKCPGRENKLIEIGKFL